MRAGGLGADWRRTRRKSAAAVHSQTMPKSDRLLGLALRSQRLTAADRAEVEFVARCREAGRGVRLHERSRFVHENGRWFYVDGDLLSPGP